MRDATQDAISALLGEEKDSLGPRLKLQSAKKKKKKKKILTSNNCLGRNGSKQIENEDGVVGLAPL